jgi:hypothetical protein
VILLLRNLYNKGKTQVLRNLGQATIHKAIQSMNMAAESLTINLTEDKEKINELLYFGSVISNLLQEITPLLVDSKTNDPRIRYLLSSNEKWIEKYRLLLTEIPEECMSNKTIDSAEELFRQVDGINALEENVKETFLQAAIEGCRNDIMSAIAKLATLESWPDGHYGIKLKWEHSEDKTSISDVACGRIDVDEE